VCSGCGKVCRSHYDKRWRRVRDLGCGDREVYLDFQMRRVTCTACGVKNEKLAFLSGNTKYTLRFAMQIGGLCRAMTIKDVAQRMHLDWHAVKELDKVYMREQLARSRHPAPNVIGVCRSRSGMCTGSSSAIWNRNARYGSAGKAVANMTWTCFMRF
jgi:transposase